MDRDEDLPKPSGAPPSRRRLIKGAAGAFAALGAPVPFLRNAPVGLVPVAAAQGLDPAAEKPGLTVLGDRPVNMETPPHLLDDDVTPAERLFVRNNGQIPDVAGADDSWRLVIDGAVETPLELAIADLKREFEVVTLQLTLECAGNGRRFFRPAASGNQWSFGAVGCPEWTGVRLRDLLNRAGVRPGAVYTAHYGADPHLSGDPERVPISRGVPVTKAMEAHSLVAFAMNGADMPALNGHPLRLVIPGFPGSCSQKWLTRITLRDRVHDGAKMTGFSYRIPAYPVAPGTDVPQADMRIIEEMPVKSLITFPETGARVAIGETFELRGAAWAGASGVRRMEISHDFGASWAPTELAPARNRFAWRRWRAELRLDAPGYYEIWARATDGEGRAQPPVPPGWNPRGYLNNMQHRVAVFAG
ncbi:MAG: molybdopterin-dependent oxidoreductase [Parvularculaceae bacterium]